MAESTFTVQVPVGVAMCQVDFPEFKTDAKGIPLKHKDGDKKGQPIPFGARSCEGALHIAPGRTLTVTASELEHLRATRPELRLHVVKEHKPKAAPAVVTEPLPAGDAPRSERARK